MIRVQNSVTRRGRAAVTVLAGNKRPVSVCFRVRTKKARPPANLPLLPTEEEHIIAVLFITTTANNELFSPLASLQCISPPSASESNFFFYVSPARLTLAVNFFLRAARTHLEISRDSCANAPAPLWHIVPFQPRPKRTTSQIKTL